MLEYAAPEDLLKLQKAGTPEEVTQVFLGIVQKVPPPRVLVSRPQFRDESAELTSAYAQVYRETLDGLRAADKHVIDMTWITRVTDDLEAAGMPSTAGGGHILNGCFLPLVASGLASDFYLPENFRDSPRMLWEYRIAEQYGLFPLLYPVFGTKRRLS